MEIFRVSKNAWGQETLIGVSWDLLPWFAGAAVLFIGGHILYKLTLAPKAISVENRNPEHNNEGG